MIEKYQFENELLFNEEKHIYTYKGVEVPSTTTVLQVLGEDLSKIPKHILEAAGHRGKVVHKIVELYVTHDLDFDTLTPLMWGYLTQFKKFLKEHQFRVKHSEIKVFNKPEFYAGQIDLVLEHIYQKYEVICDIKSNTERDIHKTQTAAYSLAYNRNDYDKYLVTKRGCLYLTPKKYTFIHSIDPVNDRTDFLAAKRVFDFRLKREKK